MTVVHPVFENSPKKVYTFHTMTKNPFINAFLAILYIVIVSLIMFFGGQHAPKKDTFLTPIAILSLFSFSAAVMGYLFLYQPLQLYFDGKRQTAVNLFLQTLAVFGIITILLLGLVFSGVVK